MRKQHCRTRLYKDLSWIWPIISPPDEYEEECEFFSEIIRRSANIEVKTLLHLGCGGGHEDYFFKKHFRVTGVDMSGRMLKLARKLNPKCEYIQGDMRKVRLNRLFDAITTGDSAVYMRTEKDLKKLFLNAYRHLKPGGLFLTVAEYFKEGFEQNKTECVSRSRNGIEITYIENQYDPHPADSSFEITFIYLIRKDSKLSIKTDHHRGGIFPLATWREHLTATGFKIKEKRFSHSSFQKGFYLPMFVCIKP